MSKFRISEAVLTGGGLFSSWFEYGRTSENEPTASWIIYIRKQVGKDLPLVLESTEMILLQVATNELCEATKV
jgi:hypothetical protein